MCSYSVIENVVTFWLTSSYGRHPKNHLKRLPKLMANNGLLLLKITFEALAPGQQKWFVKFAG